MRHGWRRTGPKSNRPAFFPVARSQRPAGSTDEELGQERVAQDPNGVFHFHRGRAYAVDGLGYDDAELATRYGGVDSTASTRRA
jgi:hypothetical protein